MVEPTEKNTAAAVPSVSALQKEFATRLVKTALFALAAIGVIAAATIAWFVANTHVQSGTTPISANYEPFKLATKGVRQEVETYFFRTSDGEQLPDGKQLLDKDGNVIQEYKDYYYTDGDAIALRLDAADYEVSPGARGKVTFYVIPGSAGGSITLQIGLGGYSENEKKTVVAINDPVLNALLSGHILLFDDYNQETNEYSKWLFRDNGTGIFSNTITVDLSRGTAGVPVPVDFYWIWPLRDENMVEDLYAENSVEFRDNFAPFIEAQAKTENMTTLGTGYRYSRVFLTNEADLNSADTRSDAYDMADEYIGGNAQYLYLTIQTTAENMEGGQQE